MFVYTNDMVLRKNKKTMKDIPNEAPHKDKLNHNG